MQELIDRETYGPQLALKIETMVRNVTDLSFFPDGPIGRDRP